jgi:uncharacterized protein
MVLLLVGSSSGVAAQTTTGKRWVSIATATQLGNYYTTGSAICRLLQRQGMYIDSGDVTLVDCAATPTAGSVQNIELLRSRMVDVALVQSDWQLHATRGTNRFTDRKLESLRALLSLNPEAFQVLAGRGTRIVTWPDLKAKKVNLGPNGSTGQNMFQELFDVHQLDSKWLAQGLALPITAHIQELCEGNIEAFGQTSGVPNSGIADAARRCGATLVKLDTPEINRMLSARPDLDPIVIPKGAYAGQSADVQTFGVLATLVATTDLPDSVAYSIVRAIMEGRHELADMVSVLKGLDAKRMIKAGLSAPLHPGAARYYREQGWITDAPRAVVTADPATNLGAAAELPKSELPVVATPPMTATTSATRPIPAVSKSKAKR